MSKGATLVAGVSSATTECFTLISQLVSKIPRLWCYFLSYIKDSFLNFTWKQIIVIPWIYLALLNIGIGDMLTLFKKTVFLWGKYWGVATILLT